MAGHAHLDDDIFHFKYLGFNYYLKFQGGDTKFLKSHCQIQIKRKKKCLTYKSLDNKMDGLHFLLESSYISMQSFHLY
jgi:hypothetical protein